MFKPWKGEGYDQDGGILGVKTLLLGESHYGPEESNYPHFTQDVVRRWVFQRKHSYFTKTTKVVLGDSGYLKKKDKEELWNSVCFYNYIQSLVGLKPGVRPSDSMWQEAKPVFLSVIGELKPAVVVVLGKDLWRNLPTPDKLFSTSSQKIKVYKTSKHPSCLVGHCQHPSTAFSYKKWIPLVQELLELGRDLSTSKTY